MNFSTFSLRTAVACCALGLVTLPGVCRTIPPHRKILHIPNGVQLRAGDLNVKCSSIRRARFAS